MVKGLIGIFVVFTIAGAAVAQSKIKIAKLKYEGGGDWYANKTALPNLIEFCKSIF